MFDPVKTSPRWFALAIALAAAGAGAATFVSGVAPEPEPPTVVESTVPLASGVDAESLPIGSCGEDCTHR